MPTVQFTEPPPAGVTVVNYHWDFGDGNEEDTGTTNYVDHTYSVSGTYDVLVTITTTEGIITSAVCPVVVGAQCAAPITADGWILWGGRFDNCHCVSCNSQGQIYLSIYPDGDCVGFPTVTENNISISTGPSSPAPPCLNAPYILASVTAVTAGTFFTVTTAHSDGAGCTSEWSDVFAIFSLTMPVNPGNVNLPEVAC